MTLSVVCLAKNQEIAETIIRELREIGVRKNDVSLLFPDTSTSKDFAHEMHTKAPEGATTGASAGGILGGAFGWLVGIGSLAIPGVGPLIAAGPILAALTGVAVGATIGGITGSLIGLGFPEIEAKRYEGKIKEGRILISVSADDAVMADDIKAVLKQAGADDIASTTQSKVAATSHDKRPDNNRTTILQVPKPPVDRSVKS
jgi:hypothetical protein